MDLQDLLRSRVLRLDGAMGTQIQQYHLAETQFERLNLSRPDVIEAIHRAYIDAGADIIETNSFSLNPELALEGARLARKVADAAPRKVWVAGSMGPTSKSLTLAPDISKPAWRPVSFDQMAEDYARQAAALIEGGVDFLLLETAFDALNTKAALYGISQVQPGFPVVVSVSVSDRSGRTLTGQTLEAFFTAVSHYPLLAFGLNCSLGADGLLPLVQNLAQWCPVPIICYPNAGLPNELGAYDQSPEQMAAQMASFDGLVNIVGGCCGTSPAHIKALPPLRSRPHPSADKHLTVSGLEAWTVDTESQNFTLIGERTNVAGSRKFARLIAEEKYDEALQIAADQIAGGAGIIDINMDDAMLDGPACMESFVRQLENDPAVARAALMIDSSHWETILKGLKNAQGKCIVNSISLKDGEAAFLEKAAEIRRLGAAMVVMAFDEEGQATTYERKIAICERAYRLLTGIGIPAQDLIFDVNVLSVGTGIPEHDRYGIDFIEAVRWIKQNLPGAYTSGGISNLSFAFRGNNPVRGAMHAVFLYHAIRAGLDMAIVNPAMLQLYDDIEPELRQAAEDVILCRRADATARLTELAARISAPVTTQETAAETLRGSVQERLQDALLSGRSNTLQPDLMAAMEELGSAVRVIEGPLMAGMEEVGRRFGEGKMFLPQVVKSAKIMKDAVALLGPYMQDDGHRTQRPVVINATVKEDVHDIGKNIAGTVLRCNGFEVIDLGVMVDKETILEAAEKHNAALIGVSGLITPSLYQMEELCREMSARGLSTPLFVGGATTSDLHTAVKLAPLYAHVFHAPDASAGAVMAQRCLQDREAFEAEQHARQETIRLQHQGRRTKPLQHTDFPPSSYLTTIPNDIPLTRIPLQELVPLFDWTLFRAVWGVKKPWPKLEAEGRAILEAMVREGSVEVRLAARFFAASREGNAIRLSPDVLLPMLRQEEGESRSLADYVPATGSGPFGIFALAVHGKHPEGCNCEACRNEYESLMQRAVRVTLAEAASVWLDRQLAPLCVPVAKPAAGYASCPDHSLKRDILSLLPSSLGIQLTESCAMQPDASICGFVILHPQAGYPDIRHISPSQFESYARARGFSPSEAQAFLSHLL